MEAMFIFTTSSPFFLKVFSTACLMCSMATFSSIILEISKNAVCMIVLTRLPKPTSSAIFMAFIT
ncbi:hypothetical protein R80B4_02619 [Fibrobacteres bacterium R8-0-B4]